MSPAKLYADNVILLLRALWLLIVALRIREEWGTLYGMEWAVEPVKSQLLLSPQNAKVVPSIGFAEGRIGSVTTAKHLGVIRTARGVSENSTCLRIRNAHATLTNLRNAKLVKTGINPELAITIFRSLFQSQIQYASFLSPCTAEARVAYKSLLVRFFGMVLGFRIYESQLRMVRLLFQIPSQHLRRKILANQFLERMKNAADEDSEGRKITQAKLTIEATSSFAVHELHIKGIDNLRDPLMLELRAPQPQKGAGPLVRKEEYTPALTLQSYELRREVVRHFGT